MPLTLTRVLSSPFSNFDAQRFCSLIEKQKHYSKSPEMACYPISKHAPLDLPARGQQQPHQNLPTAKPSAASKPSPALFKTYYMPTAKVHFQGCYEDSEQLWQDYMSGQKKWPDIVDEAHRREVVGRAALLHQWNIKPAGYQPKPNEDVVIRTGTDPATQTGRGEFSDEDLTANTLNAWNRLAESAQKMNLVIQQDEQAGFFYIPELNTLVWKPKEPIPLQDQQRFLAYLKTISTHPEVIDPTSADPKFSMEYVLAMINKGQKGLCEPVENWGNSYKRYENLIQLAKSTHHALEKTDLAQQYPVAHNRLWDLCKMRKSPEQLGIFKPGANETEILNGLKREQAEMQGLMAASFDKARWDLNQKIPEFTQFLQTSKQTEIPSIHRQGQNIYENPADTYQRLCKIQLQLDILNKSQNHAPFIQHLFSVPSNFRRKSYQEFQDQLQTQIHNVSKIDNENLHRIQTPELQWFG